MGAQRQGYEFFDHTADVGIRAKGSTLSELLVHMARGLIALIAEESAIEPRETRSVHLTAPDAESLLLVWLQELLFWFSAGGFLPIAYTLTEVTPTALRGEVRGERFDLTRHQQGREVKAVTRHLLAVRQVDGRWEGQVVVDI